MKHSQLGITLSGLIYSCIFIGMIALIAMKLFPLYNEKMKVDFALEKVATTPGSGFLSKIDLAKSVMRQFEISDVDRWGTQEFTKALQVAKKKAGKGKTMALAYEIRGPLFGERDVVLKYNATHDLDMTPN